METLDDLYTKACNTVSDCFKHCPTIYELASKCQHITELGLNSKPISISLLAAQPLTFVAYGEQENQIHSIEKILGPVKGRTDLKLRIGHSLKTQIEPTEMLVIDTYHASPRLKQELLKHAGNVKKYIVLPSTYAYAVRGEDGSYPGLADIIKDFMDKNPEWEIVHQVTHNNGMTVLQREPHNCPDLERTYSMVSFDIPEVKWVERYKIGLSHPDKGWDGTEVEAVAEKQVEALNRALRYGIVIGVERNFTTIKIDDKEVLTGYLVYHVGFRNRPRGK